MADLLFSAHYPFCAEAKEWVKSTGAKIDAAAISLGEERVASVLKEGAILPRASEMEADLKSEVLSYAASRAIVSCMANRLVSSRMAVAEAKRASNYLRSAGDQSRGFIDRVASEMNLHFAPDGQGFRLPVWEYLMNTPRSMDYKLTARELAGGQVRVSAHQRLRILEESVKKRIDNAPLLKMAEWPAEMKDAASRLVKFLPREEIAPVSIGAADFPPCINKLLEDLRTSVNVPHNGRYALAIYLIKAGLTDEQIAKLFQNAPDFSMETTTYQVKYIRQKGYSMPACSTMDTWGICLADCKCGTPVNYRERMHGANAKRSMARDES